MMIAARPTRASPACVSWISSCLPATLSRRTRSGARHDGVSIAPSGDELSAETNGCGDNHVGGDKQDSNATSVQASVLCQDGLKHGQRKGSIGFCDNMKNILRMALPSKETCVACSKQARPVKVIVAPCTHKYCIRCLRKMAQIALQDNEMFPLRCCAQEIPSSQVAAAVDVQVRRLYISRIAELALPPAERWYCPHTRCGRWIAPRHIKENSKLQKCPRCRVKICSSCRDLAHEHRDCANDPERGEVLEVARRYHWQRCPECRILVSRTGGCKHMTCRCGAEFCYVCGGQYRGCNCRDSIGLTEGNQIGRGTDLDVETIVTAMEIAEREDEIGHDGVTEIAAAPIPLAPMQRQASPTMGQARAWPVRHPRVGPPARVSIPTRPMPIRYARPSYRFYPREGIVEFDGYAMPLTALQCSTAPPGPSSIIMRRPRGPVRVVTSARTVEEEQVSSTVWRR